MLKIRLVKKRQRWSLTFYGWLLLLVFLIALFVLFLKNIIGFLSFEETIEAKVLVAEGYVPDYSFHKMIEIFDEGNYELMKSYPSYTDSGILWINNIPSHWGLPKLKYHYSYKKGVNGQKLTKEFYKN